MRPWNWKDHAFTIIVAIIAGLGLSMKAPASELQPDQASLIYALAHSVSHLPLPQEPPEIHLTSNAKLQKMACPGHPCPSIKGYQRDNKVFLDAALDYSDVHVAAVVFHEFVHYLQWAKDGPAKTCREYVDREIMAYQLQNVVLVKAGAQLVQAPAMPQCKDEPEAAPQSEQTIPLERKAGDNFYMQAHAAELSPCDEWKFDVEHIAQAVTGGRVKSEFIAFAKHAPDIDAERLARILVLIESAYDYHGDMAEWVAESMKVCQ